MQDNALTHTAKAVKDWFKNHGFYVIDWPPYSPDLNPIEHLWWALKRKLYELFPDLHTLGGGEKVQRQRLQDALDHCMRAMVDDPEWDLPGILVGSMGRRLQVVRDARGLNTKY